MCVFEQLETLRKNIHTIHDPAMLFLMNQKAVELEEEIERIKNITVKS